MQQDHEGLLNASPVSTSEVKATRTNLIISTPTDPEVFMTMLKKFENFLFALFSFSFPLYNQEYAIFKALKEYLPNARADLQHDTKTSIIWILKFNKVGYHKEIWWYITDALDSSPTWSIRSLRKIVRPSITSRYLHKSYKS